MLDVLETLRPGRAIIENPDGSAEWSRQIEGGLSGLGFHLLRLPVTSQSVGAFHIRRRVIWLAARDRSRLANSGTAFARSTASDARRAAHRDACLSSIPRSLRVDDGVPGSLDRRKRIAALGDAIDPRVVKEIGLALQA